MLFELSVDVRCELLNDVWCVGMCLCVNGVILM